MPRRGVQVKFILAVINEDLKVSNRRRAELEADMVAMGFDRMSKTAALSKRNVAAAVSADDDEDGAVAATADTLSFEYLLSMSISSLTKEKVRAHILTCSGSSSLLLSVAVAARRLCVHVFACVLLLSVSVAARRLCALTMLQCNLRVGFP